MKRFIFLILTMLLISIMALSCFTVSAFDIVITPTVACLAVIGTLITATGIYYASDADFQTACEIAWYDTTDNVRAWCASVAETWDGINTINASMGQLLYAEWLQWLDGFSAKYNYTNISTLSDCPVVDTPLNDLSVYEYGFIASYPRVFGTQICYIGTTKLIITQENTKNHIEYIFPNDVKIKFRYPYGSDTSYTTGYNIGVPIIQTMNGYNEYIHYIARLRNGGLSNSSNKPNAYFINGTQLTLYQGRIRSYNDNTYFSPEGLVYNSIEEFVYYYILTWGQNISMQYDANANTKAKALPQTLEPDEDISVVVAPSVPEIRAMEQAVSLPQSAVMEFPLPTDIPTPTTTPEVGIGEDVIGDILTDVRSISAWLEDGLTNVLNDVKVGIGSISVGLVNIWEWLKARWLEFTGTLADIIAKLQSILQSLTASISATWVTEFENILNPFNNRLIPIYNNFRDTVYTLEYQPYEFEDLKANLYGEERVVIKLSLINPYLPTARQWFGYIFWIFYVFYVYDQVYFLIRGTHALNSSIASSNIRAEQNNKTQGGK